MRAWIVLLLSCQAFGAITLTQHKFNNSSSSSATVAVTVTSTGSSHSYMVICGADGTTSTSNVTDSASNAYTQATNSAGTQGSTSIDSWYSLTPTSGVTQVTCTFSASGAFGKWVWFFEIAGFTTPVFDIAGHVSGGVESGNTATGASVTTTSSTGFVVAGILGNDIDQNPLSGNEFTAGGDIVSGNAACSLISTTAAAHQPQWHDSVGGSNFSSTTAAIKESGPSGPPPGQFPRTQ